MSKRIRLVVGLGNPGREYSKSRHNLGFMVIDKISDFFSIPVGSLKSGCLTGKGIIGDTEIVLAKPVTFMNRSGPPVLDLLKYLNMGIRELLVIHDDMDLDFGKIKLKEKGGHGGHRGVKSLIDTLDDDNFSRLRMGIGHPDPGISVVEHVLGDFPEKESRMLERILSGGRDVAVMVLCKGTKESMNVVNRKDFNLTSFSDGGKEETWNSY